MAFESAVTAISLDAAADYSAKQFYGMDINTSGQAVLISAAGQRCAGVLLNDPASGEAARIGIAGVVKVIAGGSITRGDSVAFDAAGKAKTAVKATTDVSGSATATALTGSEVVGIALSAADASDIIPVLLQFRGAIPTTAA